MIVRLLQHGYGGDGSRGAAECRPNDEAETDRVHDPGRK
jgi:hypothetical protein